jgi:exo-beta-1,3-glucanase (GH17 family)
LVHTTNAIRTYAATGVNSQIPALANAAGLAIYAGAWINASHAGSTALDDAEVQALIDLARSFDLAGAIVGNEYYLRHRDPLNDIGYLRQRILEVKHALGDQVPVTTAEIDNLMFLWDGPDDVEPEINPAYRPILDELDFVLVHIYPFWNGMPIEGAAEFTVRRYQAIQALMAREYPGTNKRVIIGEAGWPSGGGSQNQAAPSLDNQRRYLLHFMVLAEAHGVEYLYFDAFDELWKVEEPGRVGQNWGYSTSDRAAKHSFFGVLIPSEQLLPRRFHLPFVASGPAEPRPHGRASLANEHTLPAALSGSGSASFSVYQEWPAEPGHFLPTGWMGDIASISMFECDGTDPHGGEHAIRVTFWPTGTLGWAGVYWQYPENNWGDINGGINLSWANKLTFWAKGQSGGERVRFFVGGIGDGDSAFPDSVQPQVSSGFIELESGWRQYTIDLRGRDLSRVIGGFGWATDRCASASGATFYLDDIAYEYDANLPPPAPVGPVFPVYTDAAAQHNHFFPTGWLGDATVPGRVSLSECWRDSPHSGETAIRIAYSNEVIGWAGQYWVDPAENWGDRPGGFDLSGADRVTFWARSDVPGQQVTFLIGGVGYPDGTQCTAPLEPWPDSVCPKIEHPVTLTSSWTKYTIPLAQGRDLRRIVGGFGWISQQPVTFYLDDIVYEFDSAGGVNRR